MFPVRSDAYDLDRTCRCCLRGLARLVPLNKPDEDNDDSISQAMTQRTLGDVLMEFANIQVGSHVSVSIEVDVLTGLHSLQIHPDDGLPQKVCRKCISTIRAAFVFRKMCEENDAKLREYFTHHMVNVKEDKFEVYFVDDSCNSADASKFDANSSADYSFADDPTTEQKVVVGIGDNVHTGEVLMDIPVNKHEQNDLPR